MKCWRSVCVAVIALAVGCAVRPQREAESFLVQKEYPKALQAYLKVLRPHVRDGKRYIYYDAEAVTGVGVVYWHMMKYETAEKLFRFVVQRSPSYDKALFYLGTCYEQSGRVDDAVEIYSRYGVVPEQDGYGEAMQWRLDWLFRQRVAGEVRQAIQNEQTLSVSTIPQNTIAVLYFYNLTENSQWNPLQKGLAEMMIADFSQVDQLRVIERYRIQTMMEEMDLGMAGLLDRARAQQLGKILGARKLVKGAFMIRPDSLEIRAGLDDILQPTMPVISKYTGNLNQIFKLEKDIVLKILSEMGILLAPEQRDRIMQTPTQNFKAFLDYCYGLDAFDLGNLDLAQHYFQQAERLDPGFTLARSMRIPSGIFEATHIADVIQMGMNVTALVEPGLGRGSVIGSGYTRVSTRSRFQTMSAYMDAGFIPGNDARKAYEEAFGAGAIRLMLPGPPDPPFFPEDWFLPGPPGPPGRR